MLGRTVDAYKALICFSTLGRNRDPAFAAEVLSGERLRAGADILNRARRYYRAAVYARSGTDIDDIVGRAHSVLVVLNNNERIAEVAQIHKRF